MKRLKNLREDHDLTQADVAKVLEISQQYYLCYESGKNEMPLRHYITLAKFYNVSLDYIVGLAAFPHASWAKAPTMLETHAKIIKGFEEAPEDVKKAIRILLHCV